MINKANGTRRSLEQAVAYNNRFESPILLDLRRCKHADGCGLEAQRGNEASMGGERYRAPPEWKGLTMSPYFT